MTEQSLERRKTAKGFDPRILEIFDGYVHSRVSKREFISQARRYAAAGVTGAMSLEELQPNYTWARQVALDDPTIETMVASYKSANAHGTISGSMAGPQA